MQKEQEYTLPQHSDSEIALLGSILLDTEAWDNITRNVLCSKKPNVV